VTALLFAKLVLAPVFVVIVSAVARRWGGLVAGMLSGWPLITAPVAFFMALEQGPDFALLSATSILFALMGVTTYAIVYGWLAGRRGWVVCQAIAVAAYFAVSSVTVQTPGGVGLAMALVLSLVAVGLATMPRTRDAAPSVAPPWWDNWLRAAVTLIIVLAVTAIADRLGPKVSAILATYPAISSVVTPFTHARAGADAARAVARGIVLSHISFSFLFLIVATTLQPLGIAASYALAAVAASGISLVVAFGDKEIARRARRRMASGRS
jgi:hypothetical protein